VDSAATDRATLAQLASVATDGWENVTGAELPRLEVLTGGHPAFAAGTRRSAVDDALDSFLPPRFWTETLAKINAARPVYSSGRHQGLPTIPKVTVQELKGFVGLHLLHALTSKEEFKEWMRQRCSLDDSSISRRRFQFISSVFDCDVAGVFDVLNEASACAWVASLIFALDKTATSRSRTWTCIA
jgi:hypothetical protein